eukprot:m.452135 g.452135  ORF g.452135 m.452135 type:complete len:607 (-) comp21534_c0_seq2:128-1948(-)
MSTPSLPYPGTTPNPNAQNFQMYNITHGNSSDTLAHCVWDGGADRIGRLRDPSILSDGSSAALPPSYSEIFSPEAQVGGQTTTSYGPTSASQIIETMGAWREPENFAIANQQAQRTNHKVETVAGYYYPLPSGWEQRRLPRPHFVDHNTRTTHNLDPRPMPKGWEQMLTADGWAYFVDHDAQKSYWTHPCSYPLPGPNWQIMYDDNDNLYFIDHDNRKTYAELPRLEFDDSTSVLTVFNDGTRPNQQAYDAGERARMQTLGPRGGPLPDGYHNPGPVTGGNQPGTAASPPATTVHYQQQAGGNYHGQSISYTHPQPPRNSHAPAPMHGGNNNTVTDDRYHHLPPPTVFDVSQNTTNVGGNTLEQDALGVYQSGWFTLGDAPVVLDANLQHTKSLESIRYFELHAQKIDWFVSNMDDEAEKSLMLDLCDIQLIDEGEPGAYAIIIHEHAQPGYPPVEYKIKGAKETMEMWHEAIIQLRASVPAPPQGYQLPQDQQTMVQQHYVGEPQQFYGQSQQRQQHPETQSHPPQAAIEAYDVPEHAETYQGAPPNTQDPALLANRLRQLDVSDDAVYTEVHMPQGRDTTPNATLEAHPAYPPPLQFTNPHSQV